MVAIVVQGSSKAPAPKQAPASPPSFSFSLPGIGGAAPAAPDAKESSGAPAAAPPAPSLSLASFKAPELPKISLPEFKVL